MDTIKEFETQSWLVETFTIMKLMCFCDCKILAGICDCRVDQLIVSKRLVVDGILLGPLCEKVPVLIKPCSPTRLALGF